MAQKREKEETKLKVTESLPLRTTTIPAVSSPAASQLSDDQRSNSVRSPESSDLNLSGSTNDLRSSSVSGSSPKRSNLLCLEKKVVFVNRSHKRPRDTNRCSGPGCRRKLGLMEFRCRCGDTFCAEHRYSDRHDCSYDYKAAGREAISRENPIVKAAKILKV